MGYSRHIQLLILSTESLLSATKKHLFDFFQSIKFRFQFEHEQKIVQFIKRKHEEKNCTIFLLSTNGQLTQPHCTLSIATRWIYRLFQSIVCNLLTHNWLLLYFFWKIADRGHVKTYWPVVIDKRFLNHRKLPLVSHTICDFPVDFTSHS